MTDFWMWMIYKNDSIHFENNMEVRNSKSADFSNYSLEKKGSVNWATQKCKTQVMHKWDVSRFPFDEQRMHIEIEDAEHDTSTLIYAVDKVNSKLDHAAVHSEWYVVDFSVKDTVHTYETTYGNPGLSGTSSYPKIVAEVVLRRTCSWILLFKMLTGAYVAFALAVRRLLRHNKIEKSPIAGELAAVSVGIVEGIALLDLKYDEDSRAEVDMNVVCTGDGRFIEVQGTAEGAPFTREEMDKLLVLARHGIESLVQVQRAALEQV